jgi:hypothetical protein
MFLLNGKPISPDSPFVTPDGTQYPSNWIRFASPEDRKAIGITEVPDPPYYDQRFYWAPGIPKDHDQLVTQWVDQTRQTANTLISPTDWMIVRSVDNGKETDPVTKTWRENIRTTSGLKVSKIKATKTTNDLVNFVTSPEYSSWPVQGASDNLVTSDTVIDSGTTDYVTSSGGIDYLSFNSGTTTSGIV